MRRSVFLRRVVAVVVAAHRRRWCACSTIGACGAAPAWDCGFARLDARMQDTAEGFGQPIRHIFQPFFAMTRELPTPFDRAPRYRGDGRRPDLAARSTQPLGGIVQRVADSLAWLQQGRIATYLLYSFVTLVVLLALVL